MNLWVKIEAFTPLGSVKDRLALGIIEAAEAAGELKPGQTVIEATSGNTGIGLAMVCAAKGYPLVIVMAESFSVERRRLMRFLGAKVILTPAPLKATGMIEKTQELAAKHGWFMTRQFENPANPDMHARTTAREIIDDFKGEALDYWVTGYRNRRHAAGRGPRPRRGKSEDQDRCLRAGDRQLLASHQAQARKADGSPSAGHPAWTPHPMQGWTPDFIPLITEEAVDMKAIDQILAIPGPEAIRCSQDLAKSEGIFVGITSGATFAGRPEGGGARPSTGVPTSCARCPTPGRGATSPPRSSPMSRPT